MREIKTDDMFTLGNSKYITLEIAFYNETKYLFVNKLDDNAEPTMRFEVLKCTDEGLIKEKDKTILNPLLEYFSTKVNEKVELVRNLNEGES